MLNNYRMVILASFCCVFFAPEKRPTVVSKTISIFFIFTLKRPRDNLLFPKFPNKTDLHQALRRHLQKQKQPSRFMRWYSSDAKIISCLSHWGFWLKQSHCRKLSEGFSGLDERGRRASTLTWTELVNGNWVKMKKKMLSMCIWSHPSALLPFHILGLKKNPKTITECKSLIFAFCSFSFISRMNCIDFFLPAHFYHRLTNKKYLS